MDAVDAGKGQVRVDYKYTDGVPINQKIGESPAPPSIDYLGMGYNHIIGDPWGDEILSMDPGFKYPVVSLSFSQDRTTLDGMYTQPLEGWAVPTYACYHSETS